MTELFGNNFESEKLAKENEDCRKIVREIFKQGVTQRQIWMVVYLLGLSLEDHEDLRELTGFVKEYKGSELFLTSKYEDNNNGTTKKLIVNE